MLNLQNLALAHVDRLETIDARLRKTISEQDPNWKLIYVRLRQDLQLELVAMAGLERSLAAAGHGEARLFAEAYRDLRAISTQHDSRWPVVSIDYDNPDYVASADLYRGAIAKLIEVGRRVAGRS